MSGTDQHKHDEWPNLEADPNADAGTGASGGTGAGTNREDLTRQFQELGQRLVATSRAAWQSEQRQELQRDITDGLRSVRDQLNEAIGNVRSSPRAQGAAERAQEAAGTVKEQVGKAAETVRANEVIDDLRTGLASGLRELNEQLRRLTERLERRDDATATTNTTAAAADPTPASAAATAPETDLLLGGPDVATAPSVESKTDLPTKPEGPADVEKL